MTFRKPLVRRLLAAPIACCWLATMLPVAPAIAEEWIPAGSGAVIAAGAPLAVRTAPGWDAAVAYEIADGTAVTIWDGAQAAPDGSLWYPVDGGFVPVDAVSSPTTLDSEVALYQDATPDAATGDGVGPAVADPLVAAAPSPEPEMAPAPIEEWTDPAAPEKTSKEALAAPDGAVDPATGIETDPAPVSPASPATEVDPASNNGVDPITTEATDGSIDPATGEWIEAAPVETLVAPIPSENGIDPAAGQPDEAAQDAAAPADPVAQGEPVIDDTPGSRRTEPRGEPIATAYITGTGRDGAPCLTAPDWGAEPLAVLGEGESVEVRAETRGEWQPVNCAHAGGYVHTSLIAWTTVTAPEDVDDGGPREREDGHGGGASGGGNKIVDFAIRYEGHPYVYAGEGPRAFDCSGFTMFVIHNTLGIDITHDMFVQYDMGRSVSRHELQPGDLVFFENTFRRGLSHTGIYIGGGQFIHAENESTGVRISELDSDYYSSRWYGAVRYS